MLTTHRLDYVRDELLHRYSDRGSAAILNTQSVREFRRYLLEKFQMGLIDSIGVEAYGRYPVIRLEGVPPQIWKRLLYPEVHKALPYARMEYKNDKGKLTIDIYLLTRKQYLELFQSYETQTASSNCTPYYITRSMSTTGTITTGTYVTCRTNGTTGTT